MEDPAGDVGQEITHPDTLADHLAGANKHLYQAIRSGAQIDEAAMSQMRVFAELIASLGETGAPQNPTDIEQPGGPASPAAPGFPAVNAGPPGLLPMGGMQ